MRILILHQHYKSPTTGGAMRSWYLSRAFAQQGHVVTVLTGGMPPAQPSDPSGVIVHWLPVPYRNEFGFARRLIAFVAFARQSVAMAGRIGPFDLCYAVSTPLTVGWAALQLRKKYKVPFVFEVGDLWPDAPVALGIIRNPLLKRSLYRLESSIYRKAVKIVALSPPIAAAVRSKASEKTVLVVPNFADTEFFRPEAKPSDLVWQYDADGKFVVTYAGAFGWANGLERLVECAEACQKAKLPVLFLLVGEGSQKQPLQKLCARRGLRHVRFLPFCNREGVREILRVTDAVMVSFRQEAILETGCPHKFFDGLAAGKLIILNFGGWLGKLVEEANCGFVNSAPTDFPSQLTPYLSDQNLLHSAQAHSHTLAQSYSTSNLGQLLAQALPSGVNR